MWQMPSSAVRPFSCACDVSASMAVLRPMAKLYAVTVKKSELRPPAAKTTRFSSSSRPT